MALHSVSREDSLQFTENCQAISNAFKEHGSPNLETYPEMSWPCDVILCMAALNLHDKLFSPQYESAIENWIIDMKSNLDPNTGLIPHAVNHLTGEVLEGARGCSSSMLLRLMAEIDPEFAKEQYDLFKEVFLISRLGVPAIREYPKGMEGTGDVDSGPVIWDVGFSGTVVSIGTFKTFGDFELANKTSQAMDSYGFSFTFKEQKRYLLGAVPMADAFIAWSRVAPVIVD